jgi:hypothetical protein
MVVKNSKGSRIIEGSNAIVTITVNGKPYLIEKTTEIPVIHFATYYMSSGKLIRK